MTLPILKSKRMRIEIVFLLSLIASLAFLVFFKDLGPAEHRTPGTDYEAIYKPVARNILNGKGVLLERYIEYRYVSAPPGYSFILAPIFILADYVKVSEEGLIVFFNTLMTAAATCFLYLFTEVLLGRKNALITSLLWSSYPLNLWFIKNPNTEVPFILFLYGATWLYLVGIAKKSVLLMFSVGILLGFAMFIRPIALFLPFIYIIILFFSIQHSHVRRTSALSSPIRRESLRLAFALFMGSFLLIAPWIWYASMRTGHFVPISSVGITVIKSGFSYALVGEGRYRMAVPDDVRKVMERIRSSEARSHKDLLLVIGEELKENPLAMIKLLSAKVVRPWYSTYGLWWEGTILAVQLPYLILAILGIVLARKKFAQKKVFLFFFVIIILYFWSITVITLSIVRYLVPIMGFAMMFSAVTISALFSRLRNGLLSYAKINL